MTKVTPTSCRVVQPSVFALCTGTTSWFPHVRYHPTIKPYSIILVSLLLVPVRQPPNKTYYLLKVYFSCKNSTFCYGKVGPVSGSRSAWIRIGLAPWIQIRIRMEVKSWIRIQICIKTMRIRNTAILYYILKVPVPSF